MQKYELLSSIGFQGSIVDGCRCRCKKVSLYLAFGWYHTLDFFWSFFSPFLSMYLYSKRATKLIAVCASFERKEMMARNQLYMGGQIYSKFSLHWQIVTPSFCSYERVKVIYRIVVFHAVKVHLVFIQRSVHCLTLLAFLDQISLNLGNLIIIISSLVPRLTPTE